MRLVQLNVIGSEKPLSQLTLCHIITVATVALRKFVHSLDKEQNLSCKYRKSSRIKQCNNLNTTQASLILSLILRIRNVLLDV